VRRAVILLAILVVGQILLGIEAWLGQFSPGSVAGMQPLTVRSAVVRTSHVLLGSGILAMAVVAVLQASVGSDRVHAATSSLGHRDAVFTSAVGRECLPAVSAGAGLEGGV
jgi:hypothetical protein